MHLGWIIVISLACLYVKSDGRYQEEDDISLGPLSAENDDNGYGYPESEIPGVKVSKGNKAKRRKSYYRKRVVKKGGDGKTITKEYVRFGHSGNKKGNSKVQSAGETKTQQYDGSYDLLLEAWNDMQKSGDHPNREDIQKFHYKLGYQAAVNDASEAIVSGNIAERGQAAGRAAISFMDKMNIHTLQTAYTEGYEAAKTALKEGDFYLEDLLSTSSSKRVVSSSSSSATRAYSSNCPVCVPWSGTTSHPYDNIVPARKLYKDLTSSEEIHGVHAG